MKYLGYFASFVGIIGFASGEPKVGGILIIVGLGLWLLGTITEILTK